MGFDSKRRRVGKRAADNRLAPHELRDIPISSWLNVAENSEVEVMRARFKMSRGEYVRGCIFGTLARTVPEINRVAWAQLAKLSGNVNQYQAAINRGTTAGYPPALLAEVIDLIEQLRRDLIGVNRQIKADDDDEDSEDEMLGR